MLTCSWARACSCACTCFSSRPAGACHLGWYNQKRLSHRRFNRHQSHQSVEGQGIVGPRRDSTGNPVRPLRTRAWLAKGRPRSPRIRQQQVSSMTMKSECIECIHTRILHHKHARSFSHSSPIIPLHPPLTRRRHFGGGSGEPAAGATALQPHASTHETVLNASIRVPGPVWVR